MLMTTDARHRRLVGGAGLVTAAIVMIAGSADEGPPLLLNVLGTFTVITNCIAYGVLRPGRGALKTTAWTAGATILLAEIIVRAVGAGPGTEDVPLSPAIMLPTIPVWVAFVALGIAARRLVRKHPARS